VKRNEVQDKTYGKHTSWKRGLEAGKKGESSSDNPYTLTDEMWKILRQRTYWELGRIEGAFTPSKERLKKERRHKHEEIHHIKELLKPKHKHKHKHGKHKHKHK